MKTKIYKLIDAHKNTIASVKNICVNSDKATEPCQAAATNLATEKRIILELLNKKKKKRTIALLLLLLILAALITSLINKTIQLEPNEVSVAGYESPGNSYKYIPNTKIAIQPKRSFKIKKYKNPKKIAEGNTTLKSIAISIQGDDIFTYYLYKNNLIQNKTTKNNEKTTILTELEAVSISQIETRIYITYIEKNSKIINFASYDPYNNSIKVLNSFKQLDNENTNYIASSCTKTNCQIITTSRQKIESLNKTILKPILRILTLEGEKLKEKELNTNNNSFSSPSTIITSEDGFALLTDSHNPTSKNSNMVFANYDDNWDLYSINTIQKKQFISKSRPSNVVNYNNTIVYSDIQTDNNIINKPNETGSMFITAIKNNKIIGANYLQEIRKMQENNERKTGFSNIHIAIKDNTIYYLYDTIIENDVYKETDERYHQIQLNSITFKEGY